MKKKGLALLLAFSLGISSLSGMTSYAIENVAEDAQNEKVTEDVQTEMPEAEEVETETAEEMQTEAPEETEVQTDIPETEPKIENDIITVIPSEAQGFVGERDLENLPVTGVDENGNVIELPDDSENTIVAENRKVRAIEPQIVNFRKKSSVIEYKEVATGIDGYTSGAYGADAAYLGTSGGKVKFMLSGVIGQVPETDVQVINKSSAESVSHYQVSEGKLIHYISTNVTSPNYGSKLNNGPAPSYLKSGTKYYSYDGHYFYTEANFGNMIDDYNKGVRTHAVNPSNPFYNYFQYLPFRSTSNYSGSTLNSILNNRVTASSKMRDTGNDFANNQNTYGSNALLMIGIGANESGWGTSNIAQTKNNLFGWNAVDSSPGESADYFKSVSQCISEYSEKLSKGYFNPKDWKCHGAFLGNKASGMNVKYASDPYWGEKAAAMAWILDGENGNKDVNKYTIGIKDTIGPDNPVNVRKESNTSSTKFYTTRKSGNYAFIVLDSTPVNKFYKIQSEPVLNSGRTAIDTSTGKYNFSNMYAYFSSDYLKIVIKGTGGVADNGGNGGGQTKPEPIPNPKVPAVAVPSNVKNALLYSSYVSNIGWETAVKNGEQSGTTGLNYAMEGIKISTNGISNLGIRYSAHVSNIGWQSWGKDGQLAGTTGKKLSMEAIKIELTGNMASSYDIHYRAYVEGSGWQKYVSNGEVAGTTGKSKHIEAIQIVLLKKEKDIAVSSSVNSIIEYSTNVANMGWLGASKNGKQSGTVGMNSAITGIKIQTKGVSNLGIKYSTHIPNIGWQSFVADGKESSAISTPKQLEAIKIELTGSQKSKYDIYYRVHAQNYGWLGWAKNGEAAGTQGYGYRLEAVQIVVVTKGSSAPGKIGDAFVVRPADINYSTHIQNIGWQKEVFNGALSGTTGKKLRMEAIKINLSKKPYSGDIQYSAHVQDIGWQDWKKNGTLSGTSGQKKRLEAIKIKLTGDMAANYDIYYRVHAQNYGWLGWTKNGEPAGTQGYSYRLEAIQIQLVRKGGAAPGTTKTPFVKK